MSPSIFPDVSDEYRPVFRLKLYLIKFSTNEDSEKIRSFVALMQSLDIKKNRFIIKRHFSNGLVTPLPINGPNDWIFEGPFQKLSTSVFEKLSNGRVKTPKPSDFHLKLLKNREVKT